MLLEAGRLELEVLVVLDLDADEAAAAARDRVLQVHIEGGAIGQISWVAPSRRPFELDPRDRLREFLYDEEDRLRVRDSGVLLRWDEVDYMGFFEG